MNLFKSQTVFARVSLWACCTVVISAGLLVFYAFMSSSAFTRSLRDGRNGAILISNKSPDYQDQLLCQAQLWLKSQDTAVLNNSLRTIERGLRNRGIMLDVCQWDEYFPGTTCLVPPSESTETAKPPVQSMICGELLQWHEVEPSDTGLNNAMAFLSSLDSATTRDRNCNEYLICSATNTAAWQKNPLDRICLLTSRQVTALTTENIRSSLIPSGALASVGTLLLVLSLSGFAPNAILILFVSDQVPRWNLYLEQIARRLPAFCPILFIVKKLQVCPDRIGSHTDNVLSELDTVRLLF